MKETQTKIDILDFSSMLFDAKPEQLTLIALLRSLRVSILDTLKEPELTKEQESELTQTLMDLQRLR